MLSPCYYHGHNFVAKESTFDWHVYPRGEGGVRGLRFCGSRRFLSGFSVFPKFWFGFSVPNIPTVRSCDHFCAVFRFLPNFRMVFERIFGSWDPSDTPPHPIHLKIQYFRWNNPLGYLKMSSENKHHPRFIFPRVNLILAGCSIATWHPRIATVPLHGDQVTPSIWRVGNIWGDTNIVKFNVEWAMDENKIRSGLEFLPVLKKRSVLCAGWHYDV